MSAAKTTEETEETYQLTFADGEYNASYDVEATEFGVEVNGGVIEWGWILRQLAKRADKRLSF